MDASSSAAAALRGDRAPNALRQLYMRVGVNAAAAGSAYVEMGDTKVTAAV